MDPSHSPPTLRQKKRRKSKTSSNSPFPPSQPPEDGIDRFTGLPDHLRQQILSLLPLSAAIRTGALSTQWKNLWKTRRHSNREPTLLNLNIPSNGDSLATYFYFIFLILSNPKIFCHTLCLSLLPEIRHLPQIHNILHSVAACGVEDISLDLRSTSPTFRRPLINFNLSANFSSLGKLSLSGFRLSSPHLYFKNFPNLEYLSFHGINITDTAFRMIVANCRQLRYLDVRRCPDLKKVIIMGKNIANVTVVECPNVSDIVVRSKILKKFHFKGGFAREYKFNGVENLEDAYMCSDGSLSDLLMTNWVMAVGGFRHVTVLSLCSLSLQCIMAADPNVICQFKTLECVKELQLLMFSQTDQNLMDTYKFFTTCSCPVLEKIFIEFATDLYGLYVESYFEESNEPLMSDFSMVKTVKINGYKGRRNEIRLVRFFLSNAPNLKDMIIVAPPKQIVIYNWETFGIHSRFLHLSEARFSELLKSSKDAKIVVSELNDSGVRPKHEVYGNYTVSQEE